MLGFQHHLGYDKMAITTPDIQPQIICIWRKPTLKEKEHSHNYYIIFKFKVVLRSGL